MVDAIVLALSHRCCAFWCVVVHPISPSPLTHHLVHPSHTHWAMHTHNHCAIWCHLHNNHHTTPHANQPHTLMGVAVWCCVRAHQTTTNTTTNGWLRHQQNHTQTTIQTHTNHQWCKGSSHTLATTPTHHMPTKHTRHVDLHPQLNKHHATRSNHAHNHTTSHHTNAPHVHHHHPLSTHTASSTTMLPRPNTPNALVAAGTTGQHCQQAHPTHPTTNHTHHQKSNVCTLAQHHHHATPVVCCTTITTCEHSGVRQRGFGGAAHLHVPTRVGAMPQTPPQHAQSCPHNPFVCGCCGQCQHVAHTPCAWIPWVSMTPSRGIKCSCQPCSCGCVMN